MFYCPGSGNPFDFCASYSKQHWIGLLGSRYKFFKTKSGLSLSVMTFMMHLSLLETQTNPRRALRMRD